MILPRDEEAVSAQDECKIPFGCLLEDGILGQLRFLKAAREDDWPPNIKYATNSEVFTYPTTPKASPVAWDARRTVT